MLKYLDFSMALQNLNFDPFDFSGIKAKNPLKHDQKLKSALFYG